ncbi:MAG: phage Gp37/Gp68 family protein [Desulfomonile tiedjei]|nr:phage Gp37/Gp68 family protein [Desulfomonile tiedjei]
MALNSSIEWTQGTWNPLTGCTKISAGCRNCYAECMARRLQAMGSPNYSNGFKLTVHDHVLSVPLRWKRPMRVFVNSMSDLFHEEVPTDFILKVFEVMGKARQHQFQVLTKRAERLSDLGPELVWSNNIWMGVTVESADYVFRLDHLRRTRAAVKFVSFEPLLGSIRNLDLRGIDWVIVGGESGPRARPMSPAWVTEILDQCRGAGVPFFFKQWGGRNKKKTGRLLNGRIWDEMPNVWHKRSGAS